VYAVVIVATRILFFRAAWKRCSSNPIPFFFIIVFYTSIVAQYRCVFQVVMVATRMLFLRAFFTVA